MSVPVEFFFLLCKRVCRECQVVSCNDIFRIVCSFVMFVVDTVVDHIVEAYSSIGPVKTLLLRLMSPCVVYRSRGDFNCWLR